MSKINKELVSDISSNASHLMLNAKDADKYGHHQLNQAQEEDCTVGHYNVHENAN